MPADKFLPAIGHALSGSTGTAISTTITYPLDLVNTRLKVQGQLRKDGAILPSEEYQGLADAFSKIYAREGGLQAFYAGLGSDVAKSVAVSLPDPNPHPYTRKPTHMRNATRLGTHIRHRTVSSSSSSTPGSAHDAPTGTAAASPCGKSSPWARRPVPLPGSSPRRSATSSRESRPPRSSQTTVGRGTHRSVPLQRSCTSSAPRMV